MGGQHFDFEFCAGDGCGQTVNALTKVVTDFLDHNLPVEQDSVMFHSFRLRTTDDFFRDVVARGENEFALEARVEGEVDFLDSLGRIPFQGKGGGQCRGFPLMQ